MNKFNKITVVVGMSGGVDSSVCAAILKDKGYNVIGIFMKNWEETNEQGVCKASLEYEDVISVCEELDIPYYSVDFVKEYQENVFKYFIEEYKLGFTPNPDILCNREIKFKVFFNKAMELGADFLATGHYCQNKIIEGKNHLVKGIDSNKDQTYFLYTMKESILKKVMFPIGNIKKDKVREIASKYNLSTKDKKDSTGICFIGERNFKNFLSKYVPFKKGEFRTLDQSLVGTHDGVAYYTIGQRKGLGLGGPGKPWYVIKKDVLKNIVYVERGIHKELKCFEIIINELSFVNESYILLFPLELNCKIRYRQKDQKCFAEFIDKNTIKLKFSEPQIGVALRQSAVLYTSINNNEVCIGGGMINEKR